MPRVAVVGICLALVALTPAAVSAAGVCNCTAPAGGVKFADTPR